MENRNYKVTLSPFISHTLPEPTLYVKPESGWTPLKNGELPLVPFAYDSWEKEELSWYDNSYLHAGLNPFMFYDIKGIEYIQLLNDVSVSTFNKFPVGKARHTILCNQEGKIIIDGIVLRRSDDEFISMCLPDPKMLNQMVGNKYHFESKNTAIERFFFQLCGPRSLEIVEAATRQDLHDIKFMYTKDAKINGKDVFILRTGMAGTLGYEVHGKVEDAVMVYNTLLEVGKKFEITPLGRHGYRNCHVEGSIPQLMETYTSPAVEKPRITGSLSPDDDLIYRSPIDLGWEKMINFSHDFPGKEALKAEMERHHNAMVHLIWDPDDVVKVIRAAFEKDYCCDTLDMVEDYDYVRDNLAMRFDEVYDGDKMIGAASGRMLSAKTREMLSICTIDQDYAIEGKIVEVLWGTPGTRQLRIKAKVMLFPYIKEGRNESFDVETIPHPVFD